MARIKPLSYGIAPNDLLNNKNISLSAKGMYTFMNCKPENWEFSISGLISQLKEGKDKIKSMLKELEDYGYLKRKKYQTSNGRWAWEYILMLAVLPSTDLPAMVLPATVEPSMENTPHISKKDLSKKDKVKKKETISENKFSQEIINILDLFSQINPSIQYGNKTQRKACIDMIKKFGYENVIRMAEQVIGVQGEKYSPTATTPYAMYIKLGDFKVYFDRSKTNSKVLDLSK